MRIVTAAGGTGGHIFPAIALAAELKRMGHTILFMGGLKGNEGENAKNAGFDFIGVDVIGFDRSNVINLVKAFAKLPLAVLKAGSALSTFSPHAVVGAGGYASGPACLSAAMKRIPLFLLEQNVYPGLVTRKLAKKARRVYTSFGESSRWLKGADVLYAGNPARPEFTFTHRRYDPAARRKILIFGGSQGAHSINQAVIDAMPMLAKLGIDFIHQTGERDFMEIKEAYKKQIPGADVRPFFENMADMMKNADFAVCRAGASTCAELSLTGLPALLVPYPGAGGHQMLNAKAMESAGAAEVIKDGELSGGTLFEKIKAIAADVEKLSRMSANAREAAKVDAVKIISTDILKLMEASWA